MNYGNIKFNDIANGEGVRTSLFVSGCTHHCKHCFNPETWDLGKGNEVDSIDLVNKALRYKEYFKDNGGITLSGGEPLLQVEFSRDVFKKAKEGHLVDALVLEGDEGRNRLR